MSTQTHRARYLDIAKGLGILCITFLHYENGVIPSTVNTFIGSFMITIFYIVAGWIMGMKPKTEPTSVLFKKRLRSLGLPYLYWTGIILIFDIILWAFGYYSSYFIARETYKSIVLRGIGTLWFLPALLFGEAIWNWLSQKSRWYWALCLVIIFTYQWFFNAFWGNKSSDMWNIVKAPFISINSATGAAVNVAAGYLAYRMINRLRLLKANGLTFLIGLFLCIFAYFTANYLGDWFEFEVTRHLWSICSPILGPLGFILMFYCIQSSRLLNYLDYWGRNSLSLMVTHYSIVMVIFTIIVVKFMHIPFNGWITIMAFVVSMPIQYLITEILTRYSPTLLHPSKQ